MSETKRNTATASHRAGNPPLLVPAAPDRSVATASACGRSDDGRRIGEIPRAVEG